MAPISMTLGSPVVPFSLFWGFKVPCNQKRVPLSKYGYWATKDVNTYVVRPMTSGGASYALMKHPEGLDCEVFVSHSWHGGIFHLRRGVRLGWPQLHRLKNLYCCLLSNPQNLNLDEFIGGPLSESAFALALQKASHLLVVPNPSVGVYSRLWCVFEAYLGAKWNKIYLLPVVPDQKESCRHWLRTVGVPMLGAAVVGVPVSMLLDRSNAGLYSWLELVYRILSLVALVMVLPFRLHPRSLDVMSCLTLIGCALVLLDLFWTYDVMASQGNGWISSFCHYGWLTNVVPMNALVTVLLVIVKREKAHVEEQREMMQFRSLADSRCSSPADERRIREAISGSEDEVETVISILLSAGAYTDNLRFAWDNGLDIDMAGMADVRTGVFFSMLFWSVCALDLLSDTIIGHVSHHRYFALLSILYTVTVLVVPLSVWILEKKGPDLAVFALKTWAVGGMFALHMPILLCYLQGTDETENMQLLSFFSKAILLGVDKKAWFYGKGLNVRISCTVLLSRLLCMILPWAILWIGIERWNRLRIWIARTCCPHECKAVLNGDSDESSLQECTDDSEASKLLTSCRRSATEQKH